MKAIITRLLAVALLGVLLLPSVVAADVSLEKRATNPNQDQLPDVPENFCLQYRDVAVKVLGSSERTASIQNGLSSVTAISQSVTNNVQIKEMGIEKSILFIDGIWLKEQKMEDYVDDVREYILSGIPVIVIGEQSEIIKEAIRGYRSTFLYEKHATTNGYYYNPMTNTGVFLSIGNVSADAPQAIKDKDTATIASLAYAWASNQLNGRAQNGAQTVLASGAPYWVPRDPLEWYSNDQFSPYGRVHIWVKPQRLMNEDLTNNYILLQHDFDGMPGSQEFGNGWWLDFLQQRDHFAYQSSRNQDRIYDAAPGTTTNQQSINIGIGGGIGSGGGQMSGSISWGYSGSEVQVTYSGNSGIGLIDWRHELPEGNLLPDSNVPKHTYSAEPGCTISTPNNDIAVDEDMDVGFAQRHIITIWPMPPIIYYDRYTAHCWISGTVS